tara:strand:- start:299 stop:427 length:129 start_codon:yes stop_codon:yes gene_type:complete
MNKILNIRKKLLIKRKQQQKLEKLAKQLKSNISKRKIKIKLK